MLEGVQSGNGSVRRVDLVAEYVEAVVREVQLARPLRVVVDAGNAGSPVILQWRHWRRWDARWCHCSVSRTAVSPNHHLIRASRTTWRP